jgi:hypothetical protein
MEQELYSILSEVENGNLTALDAQEQILDLLNISKNAVLMSGDHLYPKEERYREDCELIKSALVENGFVNAGLRDAIYLWGEYSESFAAGWLGLPDTSEEIYECVRHYITKTHYCG